MKIAIVGVTGLVGRVMLKILEEMNFPIDEFIPVASEKSVGRKVTLKGIEYPVVGLQTAVEIHPDVALFSAGGAISLEWAPKFAEVGCRVVDNSSAWRMDDTKKLIIPEINGKSLTKEDYIIANPNCSTIQMLMAIHPLHKLYTAKRIIVSTYQSVSGSGIKGIRQMQNEREGIKEKMVYPYPIDQNALPHCDDFLENGYTKEEMKLVNETHKILDPNIAVTATAVRIPVDGGHSESINVSFEKEFKLPYVRKVLHYASGLKVQDNPETNSYPMPLFAKGRNPVFVGRIRRDETCPNTINMWVVADNLRKGAALNTIQIMLKLIELDILETDENVKKEVKNIQKAPKRVGKGL